MNITLKLFGWCRGENALTVIFLHAASLNFQSKNSFIIKNIKKKLLTKFSAKNGDKTQKLKFQKKKKNLRTQNVTKLKKKQK